MSCGEKNKKKRTNISKDQSVLICSKFKEHNGKWDRIMADKAIKKLGLSQTKISNHLNYKKSVSAKEMSPGNSEKERENIIENIRTGLDDIVEEIILNSSVDSSSNYDYSRSHTNSSSNSSSSSSSSSNSSSSNSSDDEIQITSDNSKKSQQK